MADEIKNDDVQDYEEPSLTDLEDVSGGHICGTGGSAAALAGAAEA